MIHIGSIIEQQLREQQRSVTWFARHLYCERTNIYNIFKRRSLDSELLFRISRLLNHDFFRYYSVDLEKSEGSEC